jgi:hypothetical protein
MGHSTLKVGRAPGFEALLEAKVPSVGCQSVARESPLSHPRSVRSQFLVMPGALCGPLAVIEGANSGELKSAKGAGEFLADPSGSLTLELTYPG